MDPRPVHFEIPADDPAALAAFYTALFGWRFERMPMPGFDYWPCKTGQGPGIDGAIMKRMAPGQAVTNYVTVDDMDARLAKAQGLGATVILPRTPVAGHGWVAVALDPQNNPVGFWQDDKDAK